MSLHDKLKKVKDKGEEKTIALRMPRGKAMILEKLAEYYEINTSALIREMIDDSIMKLQKDLIVLPDNLGVKITQGDKERNITYLPDVIALLSNDSYGYAFNLMDFGGWEELYDTFVLEDAKLSVEKGLAMSHSGVTPITKKEYHFSVEGGN